MQPIKDYLGVQYFVMRLVGFIPIAWPKKSIISKRLQSILDFFYGLFLLSVHFHLLVCFSVTLFKQLQLNEFNGSSYLFSQTIIWFHNTVLWLLMRWNQKDVNDIRQLVNRVFRYRSTRGRYDFKKMKTKKLLWCSLGFTYISADWSYQWARKLTIVYQTFCAITTLQYILFPILADSRLLMLRCWYPFDALVNSYFYH